MPLALLALAIGAFGIGTTEFVIMGLLPEVAGDFGVSIPTAGYLVTGYALGVMFGAPLMTVLGTKISRKRMLMLLMGLFVVGNLLSALAPTFGLMLAGRVVASLAHGAFFGIGSVVAADLVAPDKRASAISLMFTGLTVANVVGVPLGTLVGQSVGWRVTFGIVAALGVVGLLGVAKLVPDMPKPAGVRLRHELAALKNVQVLLAMAMTVLGFGGVFAAITYIAPMVTHVTGFADGSVTWLLVLFGLGMVGGNLDRRHIRRPRPDAHAVRVPRGPRRRPGAVHPDRPRQDRRGRHRRPRRRPRLRHRPSAAEAGPGPRARRARPGLGPQHRRLQPGQRAVRLAGRPRDRRRVRLHRPNWAGAVLAAAALALAVLSVRSRAPRARDRHADHRRNPRRAADRRPRTEPRRLRARGQAAPAPADPPPVRHHGHRTHRKENHLMTTTAVAPLTTADAEALVGAAVEAEKARVTVSVAVLDAGGHLLAFRRDHRAVLISGETSTRKAYTALQLNTPTAELVDAVQPGGLFHTPPTALDRPLLSSSPEACPYRRATAR
ncbi:sugar efflux transporter [Streptomyces griseoloalbus]